MELAVAMAMGIDARGGWSAVAKGRRTGVLWSNVI